MNKSFRAGPWSKKDKQYISDQAGKMPPEEIASKLGRNPSAVKKYMTKQGLMKYYFKKDLEDDQLQNIRKSRYWEELEKEFTQEELDIFEYHWKNIIKQFRDDIMHTEELQIVDAIKLEIKMQRCLRKEKQINDNIDKIRLKIKEEEGKQQPDERKIDNLNRDLTGYYSSMANYNDDYLKLQKEKNAALSKLKATREQRIQQIESSKETLAGWVKALYTNPQLRYKLGLDMEKMRLAAKAEYERLSKYHVYQDQAVDKPILNHETVWDDTEKTEQILDTQKPENNV